jgi:magnesium transporter
MERAYDGRAEEIDRMRHEEHAERVGGQATADRRLSAQASAGGHVRVAGQRARGRAAPHSRKPGARPGTFRIPPDAPQPSIRLVVYDPESFQEREIRDVEELTAVRPHGHFLWIDVSGFGDEGVLVRLGEIFGIHPLAMADAVNVPQRPKVEDYEDRHLVVTRAARLGAGGEVAFEQISLILGPGWLCTFRERPSGLFDPVRERLRGAIGIIRRMGPDYLAYALIAAVIDGYFPVVEAVGDVIDRLEEEVMDGATRRTLHRIHDVRRLLITLHRVQWRQRDALAAMLRDETSPFTALVRPYVRDLHDHSMQVLDVIETSRDLTVGLLDVYLSTVNNRMSEVMKTLTVIGSVFIPLTFLVGVYGMNFEHMPELHWRYAYPALWALMVVLATGLLLWFRRRGWMRAENAVDAAPSSAASHATEE